MRELTVELGDRTYPILISAGILADGLPGARGMPERAAIVTNAVVAPLYLESVQRIFSAAGVTTESIVLADGEATKNWETLNAIHDFLLQQRYDRKSMLIALGGGVTGDLAGFAAATYQRGIEFIQVPTTLLAQVDSSVGGKTGINHPRGKNMIGAFWQPRMVLVDTTTLATLPPRELSAGMAEVIKYGLIRDLPFLEWIEANIVGLMGRDPELLAEAIERSCANKAEVVSSDEKETAKDGGRALLNLGHTFGHAIETGAGYGNWLHGEAVAAGTVMAAELSRRVGWLTESDVSRVRAIFERAGLPVRGAKLGPDRYLELMSHDKKVMAGRLRLVLLRQIGEAVTYADAPGQLIRDTIEACCV